MKKTGCMGIFLVGMAVLASLAGCAEQPQESTVEIKETLLRQEQKAEALRGDVRVSAFYDAWVGPKVEQLTFAEEGTFGEFKVQLGDEVKKGDILAVPYMAEGEEAVRKKEKELESLTVNYEYQKSSLENQIEIAKYELDNVYNELKVLEYGTESYTAMCILAGTFDQQGKRLQLQLRQSAETYELQRSHLESQLQKMRTQGGNAIRAPYDGVVVALGDAWQGDAINPSLYYVAVADPSVIYARCENIPEVLIQNAQSILFWKDGEEYNTTLVPQPEDYYKEKKNSGKTPYLQFSVEAPESEVALGDYGKIRLVSREARNVLTVPELAVRFESGVYYVYVDAEGEKKRVNVEIGLRDGLKVEITSGLKEGDVVYVQQ